MDSDLYKELYKVENRHWWHQHKRALIHQLIRRFAVKGKVLDLGAGTGKMLIELKTKGWQVAGLDNELEAIKWSKKRKIQIKLWDIESRKFPFKANQFEAVLMLDVLEHLVNERRVLNEIKRVLKPKGVVIITVPAYQWLFSYWDKKLGHQRRYTIDLLKKKILSTDLEIKFLSYFCSLFLPGAVIVRIIKKLLGKKSQATSDFQTTPLAFFSIPLLKLYASLERRLLKYFNLPFGLSIIGVFQK